MPGFENAGKKTLRSQLAKVAAGILEKPAVAFISYLVTIGQCTVVSTLIAGSYRHAVGCTSAWNLLVGDKLL